jgi:hypothetical protein
MRNFRREIYRTLNTTRVGCNAVATSGGYGVTELILNLDKPLGGIVVVDFDAQSVPDKLEMLHNGVKKGTSGMSVANAGPFDDIYGSPTIPDSAQASTTDQFIGLNKGTIPNRYSTFVNETGVTDLNMTKQQLIWWVYTEADYNANNTVTVRVTGINGTQWSLQRLCTDMPASAPVINSTCYTAYDSPSGSFADNCLGQQFTRQESTVTVYLSQPATKVETFTVSFDSIDCQNASSVNNIGITINIGQSQGGFSYVSDNYVDCGQGSCNREYNTYLGTVSDSGLATCP